MSSAAQVAANLANSQNSTGPRTEAGKAKTRTNATTHGLCRSTAIVPDEDVEQVNLLYADLVDEHRPATPTEEILAYKMAVHFLSFKRAENLLVRRLHANTNGDESKQVALMLRYQTTADRAFNKNLSDLRKLQKERGVAEPATEPAADPIGSVSQNAATPTQAAPANPPEPTATTPGTVVILPNPDPTTLEITRETPSATPEVLKEAA